MTHSIKIQSLFAIALVAILFSASHVFASGYSNDYYTYGYPSNYAYNYPSYDYTYAYAQRPSCSITVRYYNGSNGYDRSVTLAWSSSYATSAYLSGVGSVGTNGVQAVFYPYNNFYTLTVYGPGGSATCQTDAVSSTYYNNQYPVYGTTYSSYTYPSYSYPSYTYPTYTYPTYTYVPLTQIPYTGFDYGTFGNMLYWLGLMVVALCGAYLIVYHNSRALPREFAREVAVAARNQIRFMRSVIR